MGRSLQHDLDFGDIGLVLRQAPVFIAVHDRQRRLQWASSFAFGYGREMLGKRTEHTIHTDDLDTWLHAVRLALDTGAISSGTCRCAVPDGGPIMRIAYRIAPYRVGQRIVGFIAVTWDVTFERQIQPLAAFMLTERSRRIVEFLNQNGPAKGVVIGRYLGELSSDRRQAASKVRVSLAHMEERGILRNTGEGYEITPEFRAAYLSA